MNINPAFPRGVPVTVPNRGSVAAVTPAKRARDATEEAAPGQRASAVQDQRDDTAAQIGIRAGVYRVEAADRHTLRALEAYRDVSTQGPQEDVQRLLGLDEFA